MGLLQPTQSQGALINLATKLPRPQGVALLRVEQEQDCLPGRMCSAADETAMGGPSDPQAPCFPEAVGDCGAAFRALRKPDYSDYTSRCDASRPPLCFVARRRVPPRYTQYPRYNAAPQRNVAETH